MRDEVGHQVNLAAAVFVAEGVFSAVGEAMQSEALVARMNQTVF